MGKEEYKIWDGSYALAITEKGLKDTYPASPNSREINKYKIIAEGCRFPSSDDSYCVNDTIVRNVETGTIVFTKRRFIKRINKFCSHCGSKI